MYCRCSCSHGDKFWWIPSFLRLASIAGRWWWWNDHAFEWSESTFGNKSTRASKPRCTLSRITIRTKNAEMLAHLIWLLWFRLAHISNTLCNNIHTPFGHVQNKIVIRVHFNAEHDQQQWNIINNYGTQSKSFSSSGCMYIYNYIKNI